MGRQPDVSRDTFQPKKDYVGLIFRHQRPLLDAELNELQDIVRSRVEEAVSATLVNGPLSDSYQLSIDLVNSAKIWISQGVFYYYGRQLIIREDASFTFEAVGPVTEFWTVYLEAWFDYIDETQDPEIKDPTLPPTSWRLKQFTQVKLTPSLILPWTTNGHVSIPLWIIKRPAGGGSAIVMENAADQRMLAAVNYVLSGGKVLRTGALTVSWEEGDVLLCGRNQHLVAGSVTMPPNATRVLFVDKDMSVILDEFPVLNRPLIPLARIYTDAGSITGIDDLRPYWSPKEFPEWEEEYTERMYPFRKSATLKNSFGKLIPRGFIRDLRISNSQFGATYYVARIVGSTTSPTVQLYIANTSTVQQVLFNIPVPDPKPQDGLMTVQAVNNISGESAVGIFDVRSLCALFQGPDLEDNLFDAGQTPILDTLVSSRNSSPGLSPFINNWRDENLQRDYPIRGTSLFLRSHVWDALLNCARDQEVGYFISVVHLNHADPDFLEVSSHRYVDGSEQIVARLERLGAGELSETWVTKVRYSLFGEVVKLNADFSSVIDPTHLCFTYEEGKFYDGVGVSCKEFGNFCMGDACVDVRIIGTSRGFGGTQAPIPILIDSNCYPVMVSVAFAEICCCESTPHPYYYYYYYPGKEDCVEICPGARDCGVWYLQYRQTGKQDRVIRLQYGYMGVICEHPHEVVYRLTIGIDESCEGCFSFSYMVYAPGRLVMSQLWDFGDSKTSTELRPTHQYAAAGSYIVALTVTLDDGTVLTETMQIMV